MHVLAIDPGNEESAYVVYDSDTRAVLEHGKVRNAVLLDLLRSGGPRGVEHMAIEMIASYGMAVGREVFETCLFIGRFLEAWDASVPATGMRRPPAKVYRRQVKLHICESAKATDSNIREALLDRWGGKLVAVGRKATPGPLYGISGDEWSALAVAVTYAEESYVRQALGAAASG